ncbi:uncharacterized protein LOC135834500 isoform X8 [Planococcus citri]|uniref:uncharacterized protein LOC135834500 isoform X8 n=1 Tax=Planococcus citri TaxID=170843 RepID=UPI0031F99BF6
MAEMVSNVHDLMYPSPASLKEISCQALVTGLWRWGVENRVTDDFISGLDMHKNLPFNMPSSIKRMIEVCSETFIASVKEWSAYHRRDDIFEDEDETDFFLNFYDFICDRDGTVHYTQTARKMMKCDRLSDDEKFKIACLYCFEDDIRRLWPSVSENIEITEIEFDRSPELFYWICMLSDERDWIPIPDDEIDLYMLETCESKHWSSVEYFWNRVYPYHRLSATINLSNRENGSFVRFILPKLSDELLGRLVLEKGNKLIYDLVTKSQYKLYALPTWLRIRNKMNESNFTKLVESLMKAETNHHIAENTLNENSIKLGDRSSTDDQTYLCCEIWRSSPDEWKQSTVRNILTQGHLFVRNTITRTEYREISFLLTLLSVASFEDRNVFWKKNCRNLIVDTRGNDLQRIMELCFKDENDIAKFKETNMFDYESISACCIRALGIGHFEHVDDILIFCFPDAEKRMDSKQRLLRSCVSDESFVLKIRDFSKFELMNEFIDDTFDDAEYASDFKNCIISFCAIEDVLHQCIHLGCEYSSDHFIRFIDTFVSNEEVRNSLKQRVLEYVRNSLLKVRIGNISADDLQKILVWCLGNEEEVTKFKKSVIPMSDSSAKVYNWRRFTPLDVKINDRVVGGFLKWYFRNPEEINEFNVGCLPVGFQTEIIKRCDGY